MDSKEKHLDLLEALEYVNPTNCDYNEWLSVGMALHESGFSWEVWDLWSQEDPARYRQGECERKFKGFGNSGNKVKSGTLVKMAKDGGWTPSYWVDLPNQVLDWDSEGINVPDRKFFDAGWIEPVDIAEVVASSKLSQAEQLNEYLKVLFNDDEYVGYVTESWIQDGRAMPTKGHCDRTAIELREELARYGDITKVLGDYKHEVGAWIRFNPLDGKGVGNTNVTEYRYALVESDVVPPEKQLGMIHAMNLPCAAIVSSGNKSVHAIVKIDAGRDYDLYRKRVDALYTFCRHHGFQPDTQNKNPSRLSRMPGIIRGDKEQALIETNTGAESWTAWQDWIAETQDDLPDTVNLAQKIEHPDPLSEPIIGTEEAGLLRKGHKMLIAGPSKAGKSMLLMELALAVAKGTSWCGYQCKKGKVLYINLEIDPASFVMRFKNISDDVLTQSKDTHMDSDWAQNIDMWNLRGHALPMDELTPRLIHRAKNNGYSLIVIDPIYKVITGDENNASEMSKFCNQFDKVAANIGAAVVYCHHHSKGAQGGKRAMDRASGSGVFARDPDAILDIAPLEVPEDVQRDMGAATAWRMSATLREFATPEPIDMYFRYPLHVVDWDGSLAKYKVEGEELSTLEKREKRDAARAEKTEAEQKIKNELIRDAIAACKDAGVLPTRKNVLEQIGEFNGRAVSMGQLEQWTKKSKAPWTEFEAIKNEAGLFVLREISGAVNS